MKELCRNKRAVSTVISTILMIMVVMVGMTVAFGYVVDYVNGYKNGAGTSVLESLTIEDVWIQSSQNVTLSVYNTGTSSNLGTDSGVDITIATIYVNGTALTNPSSHSIDFSKDTITSGGHAVIPATFAGSFNLNNNYDFKIVTVRGSSFVAQVHYASA